MSSTAAHNYRRLCQQIADKAQQCGRDPDSVNLIVVSKTHPWDQVFPVYEEGCMNFGENRIQEALPKIQASPEGIAWHLIGTLQKNKVRKAVESFTYIHSVDNLELAKKIAEVSVEMGKTTSIFLQVNVSGEETKHGFTLETLKEQYYDIYVHPGIRIEGLMTMAPHLEREKYIRECFAQLRSLKDELGLHHLSMGMTQDWQLAVEEGATFLRVGSAIFGERDL